MPAFWNICLETLHIAKNVATMNCRKVIYADTFWRYRTTHNSALSLNTKKNQPQQNQPNLKGKRFSVHYWSECLLWCWLLIINMVISLWERLSPGGTESPKEKGYVLKLRRMNCWYKQQSCFILPLNLPVYADKVSCFELRNAPVRIENFNFIGYILALSSVWELRYTCTSSRLMLMSCTSAFMYFSIILLLKNSMCLNWKVNWMKKMFEPY